MINKLTDTIYVVNEVMSTFTWKTNLQIHFTWYLNLQALTVTLYMVYKLT